MLNRTMTDYQNLLDTAWADDQKFIPLLRELLSEDNKLYIVPFGVVSWANWLKRYKFFWIDGSAQLNITYALSRVLFNTYDEELRVFTCSSDIEKILQRLADERLQRTLILRYLQ